MRGAGNEIEALAAIGGFCIVVATMGCRQNIPTRHPWCRNLSNRQLELGYISSLSGARNMLRRSPKLEKRTTSCAFRILRQPSKAKPYPD
jgi:hypothetical protein